MNVNTFAKKPDYLAYISVCVNLLRLDLRMSHNFEPLIHHLK